MTATRTLTETEIQATILHRDAMMLVLNKPAGIAVHATGHDKLALDQSFPFLQFGLPKPPALAHRLDRGTSGCLVLGRHRQALIKLGKLFEQKKIEKTYLAIVVGVPAEPEGIIDRPILKSGHGSLWTLSLALENPLPLRGRDGVGPEQDADLASFGPPPNLPPTGGGTVWDAVTHYKMLKTNGTLSLLEMSPKTGRTHQLRLHAAYALGCPMVGDPFYSKTAPFYAPRAPGSAIPRLSKEEQQRHSAEALADPWSAANQPIMLHAHTITIPLQPSKPPVFVEASVPEGMARMIGGITWG